MSDESGLNLSIILAVTALSHWRELVCGSISLFLFFSERLWDAQVGEKLIVFLCKTSNEVARELFVIVEIHQIVDEFISKGRLCPRN